MSTTEQVSATEGVRPSKQRNLARYVLILGGLSAFGPLSIDMYLPALPVMTSDLGTSDATLQLTLSAFIVGLAIGQIVIGPLSDAIGRRKPLVAGLAIYVVASVLCAVSPTAELLIASRALQAVGAAAGIVIARATVRDLFSGIAMTRFFSMLMLVNGLAPILAPIVGGQVLNFTSWRGVFVVLTVFGALLLIISALFLPEPLAPENRRPARFKPIMRTYGGLLRDRNFVGYALASGLLFGAVFAYIAGSSFALQDVYELSPQQYSLVFGLNGIGIVALGQVNGRIVGRFSERSLLRFGLGLASVGAVGILLATSLHLSLAFVLPPLFLLISSIGLIMPNATSLAMAEHPRTAGSASALLGVLQFAVGGLATPLVGLGGQGSAVPMAVVMTGFTIAALVAFLTLPKRR